MHIYAEPHIYSPLGLPDLSNEITGLPVKFEFQINNFTISMSQILHGAMLQVLQIVSQYFGHTYTIKLFFNLKFKLNYILSDQLKPQPFVYVVESHICS